MGFFNSSPHDIAPIRVGPPGKYVFYVNGDLCVLGHRFSQRELLVHLVLGKCILNKAGGCGQELEITDDGTALRFSYADGVWTHWHEERGEERRRSSATKVSALAQ